MKKAVLNYRVIIEPEIDQLTGKTVYTAYAPKLGVADWGKTVEKSLENIREAIECYLESLIKHKKSIPAEDTSDYMVANTRISLSGGLRITFA
ncbi:MAG: type II toxin-antitoxin system HicB family antitoxin [bacterium]|nr:type II toxin-antitoxin system HicB family antitoxin [bacterium]